MRSASEISRAAVPRWKSKVEDIIAVDDKVVERFTSQGTHKGELVQIHPPGAL